MPAATDKLSLGYETVWNALLAWSGFTAIVQPANRLTSVPTGAEEAIRDSQMVSDLPMARLVPAGGHIIATSTTADVQQRLALELATPDTRIHTVYFPLKVAVMAGLWRAGPQLGRPDIIVGWRVDDIEDQLNGFELELGASGWGGVFYITLFISFNKTDFYTN